MAAACLACTELSLHTHPHPHPSLRHGLSRFYELVPHYGQHAMRLRRSVNHATLASTEGLQAALKVRMGMGRLLPCIG